MPEQIKSIAAINAEAKCAALKYSDINDACPYPFGSDSAHAFKAAFYSERARIAQHMSKPVKEGVAA